MSSGAGSITAGIMGAATGAISTALSKTAPGVVHGIVTQNNDPEKKGHVKVQYKLWEDGKDEANWVRLMVPYGGPEYGQYIVPEIGDEVLIAFTGGSLKEALVLGSLYRAGNAMVEESFHDTNGQKHFKTKGKVDVMIYDVEGEQRVTLTTPKGSIIEVEDKEETCTISDKDKKNKLFFDYKNGEIEMLADKKITFKTGGVEMVMDGVKNDFSLKADNNIDVKATNQTTVDGGVTLGVKGVTSKYEGTSITVQGSASVAISKNVAIS